MPGMASIAVIRSMSFPYGLSLPKRRSVSATNSSAALNASDAPETFCRKISSPAATMMVRKPFGFLSGSSGIGCLYRREIEVELFTLPVGPRGDYSGIIDRNAQFAGRRCLRESLIFGYGIIILRPEDEGVVDMRAAMANHGMLLKHKLCTNVHLLLLTYRDTARRGFVNIGRSQSRRTPSCRPRHPAATERREVSQPPIVRRLHRSQRVD